jgi:hypothetical protein
MHYPSSQPAASPPDNKQQLAPRAIPTARLGRAIRLTLREGWDHLGIVMAVSATWLALFAVPLYIGRLLPVGLPLTIRYAIVLLACALALSAPLAGAHDVARRIVAHDEVSYLDFWRGARRLAGPATRLGLVQLIALGIFATNFWFYIHLNGTYPSGFVARVAIFICFYVFLAWGMMTSLHYPILVAQEAGVFDEQELLARRGALAALRRAFFLALGRPFYTLGLLLIEAVTTIAFAATGVLLALFWVGGIALLNTQATHLLLVQYGVLPQPPIEDAIPDEQFRIPREVGTRKRQEDSPLS